MDSERSLAVDIDEATRFLHRLDERGARFAFQVYDDAKMGRVFPAVLWTPCGAELLRLNRQGAGVFVAPNRFRPDARKRLNENVAGFRCCYADLDGAPLEPVLAAALAPRIVVSTSPGRWHAHWPLEGDCDARAWRAVQAALAARFRSDRSMDKPCGVVRLPGFWHRKREPAFQVRTERLDDGRNYRIEELVEAFEVTVPDGDETRRAQPFPEYLGEGERHAAIVSLSGTLRSRNVALEVAIRCAQDFSRAQCGGRYSDAAVEEKVRDVYDRYEVGDAWMAAGDAEDTATEKRLSEATDCWEAER